MKAITVSVTAILFALSLPHNLAGDEHLPRGAATDVGNAEIQAMVQKTAAAKVSDQQIRVVSINGEYNVGVGVVHRAKTEPGSPGNGIEHSQITEVYHFISGNATLMTGGKLVDEKRTNAENLSGTAIEGGTSRSVAKGDFIIVPENTPHWFSAINGTVVLMTLHVPRPVAAAH